MINSVGPVDSNAGRIRDNEHAEAVNEAKKSYAAAAATEIYNQFVNIVPGLQLPSGLFEIEDPDLGKKTSFNVHINHYESTVDGMVSSATALNAQDLINQLMTNPLSIK